MPTPEVAVCLTGQPRDVLAMTMPRLMRYVLGSLSCGALPSIFIVSSPTFATSPQGRKLAAMAKGVDFAPDPNFELLANESDASGLQKFWWKKFSRYGRFNRKSHNAALWRTLLQWKTLDKCWKLTTAHEHSSGRQFDVVMRTRLDAYWFGPHPKLVELGLVAARQGERTLYTPQHFDYGGINDRYAVGTRAGFEVYAAMANAVVNGTLASALDRCSHGSLQLVTAEMALKAWLRVSGVQLGLLRLPFCLIAPPATRSAQVVCRFHGSDGRNYDTEGSPSVEPPPTVRGSSVGGDERFLAAYYEMVNHPVHTAATVYGRTDRSTIPPCMGSSSEQWSVNGWRMRPGSITKRAAPSPLQCGEFADRVAALGLLQRTRAVSMAGGVSMPEGPLIHFMQIGGMLPANVQLMKGGPLYVAIGAYHHFSASRNVRCSFNPARLILPLQAVAVHPAEGYVTWYQAAFDTEFCSSTLRPQRSSSGGQCRRRRRQALEHTWCKTCSMGGNAVTETHAQTLSLPTALSTLMSNEGVQIGTLKITNNGGELALVRSLASLEPHVLHSGVHMLNVTCFDAAPDSPFSGSAECAEVASALRSLGYTRQAMHTVNCPCRQRMITAGLDDDGAWQALRARRVEEAKKMTAQGMAGVAAALRGPGKRQRGGLASRGRR